MSARPLVCVVEGDGEVEAIPLLVARMLRHFKRDRRLTVDPQRILNTRGGGRLTAPFDASLRRGVEFYARIAARDNPGAILVLIDAEDRCMTRPAGQESLGPELLRRARSVTGEIPLGVVVANRMFESWFLADFHSLRSRRHLPANASLAAWRAPETLGGCKGWMESLLGRKYNEPVDQPTFTRVVSLPLRPAMQRRAPSYARLLRVVDRLSREARS